MNSLLKINNSVYFWSLCIIYGIFAFAVRYFIRQHSEYSCGLACLTMIVKYYGSNARQEDLRSISGTTIQGTSLLGLYQAD